MPPPGPPLHCLQLGGISVPLRILRIVKSSGDLSRSYQELLLSLPFLIPLWIALGLDYYMRHPIPMVRILREAIRSDGTAVG